MKTAQRNDSDTEQQVVLKLMQKIEDNPAVSQRALAAELGIALGLTNAYIKRCIKKGWMKARQVPAKRLAYYLTPEGFREKSRLVGQYLTFSLSFFKRARRQWEDIFEQCKKQGIKSAALIGDGELAEIARLMNNNAYVTLVECKVTDRLADYEVILLADIKNPQKVYEKLCKAVGKEKILYPPLLGLSKNITSSHSKKRGAKK